MTFDRQGILDLFSGYGFEEDADHHTVFSEEDIPNLKNFLHNIKFYEGVKVNYGASKCVIIPPDEDYVIKIPFTGSYIEIEENEFIYEDFGGAEEAYGWDYCLAESNRYYTAEACGFEKYLARTLFIGCTKDNFPIYIQPKCEVYTYSSIKTSREEQEKTSSIANKAIWFSEIPLDWLTAFRLEYGEKSLIDFLNFLEEYGWDDLTDDNIGFLDGKPIIFDYSSFYA